MNAIWVRRFLDVLIVLFGLVIVASLVQVGGSIAGDTYSTVGWTASGPEVAAASFGSGADFSLKTGTISVEDMPFTSTLYWVARLAVLGLMVAAFLQLRGILGRIAQSRVFDSDNVMALRRIGWFLLVASLLSIAATIAVQTAILYSLPPLDGVVVHPSISWDVKGVENIWLEYDPPIPHLLLAFIAFLSASAFRSGMEYREDSESVV